MQDRALLNKSILVAEDNPINLKVIEAILKRAGVPFSVAQNGQEALLLYQQQKFNLILMDCQMPGMNGLIATEEIRKYEKEKAVERCPIIALTANAMRGDREKCIQVGMDDFLSKPFKNNELIEIIKKWSAEKTNHQQ